MKLPENISLKFWAFFVGCVLVGIFSVLRIFDNYELIGYDLRFRLRPPIEVSKDILIIEISDDTIKNLGTWPLPRDFHASLIDVLKEYGARAIVLDVLLPEPTVYDRIFSDSIKRAGNVYLAIAFYTADKGKAYRALGSSDVILADIVRDFKENAAGIGHINISVDSDGKVRRAPLLIKYQDGLYPLLGFKAACDWLKQDVKQMPVLPNQYFMVNYPDKWSSSFQHFSYFEILKAYADKKQGIQPQLDLSIIKDKACFVGLTATGATDLRPTPLEAVYPMLGLHASVFNSIVNKNFIKDAGIFSNTLINIIVFILSFIVSLRFSPVKAFFGNIVVGFIYFAITTVVFIYYGIWIDLFFPLLTVVLVYIGTTSYRVFNETRKRQLLEKELDIARTIQKSFLPEDIKEFQDLQISSFIQPAKFVAGDLYDILIIDDKRLGVFIGDVSGKGVGASLIMAQAISFFRIFSRQYPEPSKVLRRLNEELYGKLSGGFVTCLYMVVDIKQNNVAVSSAGGPPLLLFKDSSGDVSEPDACSDLPLGIMEDVEYKDAAFDFLKADKIIAFTDGLAEARNKKKQEFGLSRVKDIILRRHGLSSQKLTEAIKEEVFGFSSSAQQHDDITLIVLSFK